MFLRSPREGEGKHKQISDVKDTTFSKNDGRILRPGLSLKTKVKEGITGVWISLIFLTEKITTKNATFFGEGKSMRT